MTAAAHCACLQRSRRTARLGVQLVGNDPQMLAHAIELLKPFKFDVIDLNAACPARKVVGVDQGAALMKEPARLEAFAARHGSGG